MTTLFFSLIAVLLAGGASPLQTAVNSRLRDFVDSPLVAATVSFTVGTLILIATTLLTEGTLAIPAETLHGLPWWSWLGGVVGLMFLTGNIFIFSHLGSVQSAFLPVVGQIVMSMMIEQFGWFGSHAVPMTLSRGSGIILVMLGLMCYFSSKHKSTSAKGLLPWQILALLLGMVFATQPVMNGCQAALLGSGVHAALVSFLVSTVILYVLVFSLRKERPHLAKVFRRGKPLWTWSGGLLGAFLVTVMAIYTPLIGVGIVTLASVLGMLLMSTVIDSNGWFGAKAAKVSLRQSLGLAVVVAGIALIKFA